jgi:hypothetical protein
MTEVVSGNWSLWETAQDGNQVKRRMVIRQDTCAMRSKVASSNSKAASVSEQATSKPPKRPSSVVDLVLIW